MRRIGTSRRTSRSLGIAAAAVALVASGAQALTIKGARQIAQRTVLSDLTIAPGAILQAPPGSLLSLTVDGKSVPIAPGRYQSRIVLTPTEAIPVTSMLGDAHYQLVTGLYVDNGHVVPSRSVLSALGDAQVSDQGARNVVIDSSVPMFTGIMIGGTSHYTLEAPRIILSANGGDDSIGYGAGIRIGGDAVVTINRPFIRTHGVIRTAIFVDGQSNVTVNDADIYTANGVLPAGYQVSVLPGKMMEVPYGLGLTGNVRATNVQGTATVTYNHSHIRSQGWGALATDGPGPDHLIARDCLIENEVSGYGAYANGEAQDLFDHSTFNVVDYGLVVGGPGSARFTNRSVVNSKRFGVMMHQGQGGGTLVIDGGSVFNTAETAIEVKGRGTTILIDGAELHPGNGVLIQTMENDDPFMKAMMAGGLPPGAPPPPAASGPPPKTYSGDVIATFRNVHLVGDVVHAMPGKDVMALTLEAAELKGAVSTGTASPRHGVAPTQASFREIGEVANRLGLTPQRHGLTVKLDGRSRWVVGRTSYLTDLVVAPGASVTAPPGQHLAFLVDGKATPLAPGSYSGRLVLQVAR